MSRLAVAALRSREQHERPGLGKARRVVDFPCGPQDASWYCS